MSSKVDTLRLYRALLKELKYYPSIKRAGIIQAVKEEFRQYQNETDVAMVKKKLVKHNKL